MVNFSQRHCLEVEITSYGALVLNPTKAYGKNIPHGPQTVHGTHSTVN